MTHIAFLLYPDMTALDVIGPHEVLARLPGAAKRANTHWIARDRLGGG